MPGAGTDKTRNWVEQPGPVVILVEPQLGENIGAAARVMANFGLSRLRLVSPRQEWPNPKARMMAAGADRVLDGAVLYDTFAEAVADCTFLLATTARAHDQAKPVMSPEGAARELAPRVAGGETVAIVFGRERIGLTNEEVALADAIVTLPVNPAFASLNLAQAVAVLSYEWFKLATDNTLPFAMPRKSAGAPKQQMAAFLAAIERELDRVEFFRPEEKRPTMLINLQNIFTRMQPTQQDIQTLSGVIMTIAEGRKGPARGGILDDAQASQLRTLIAEQGEGRAPSERTPVRGLAKLLRRNPTDAERMLWDAMIKDRRFAGLGFKRQVPIGPHIVDIVSFPLRMAVDIAPAQESADAARARADKLAWLRERNYRVMELTAVAIEGDVDAAIAQIDGILQVSGALSKE
jgi:tRNA/rRNA methyltransferase